MSSEERSNAARAMGSVRSEKKTAAARENGAKGGTHPASEEWKQNISEGLKRSWAAKKAATAAAAPVLIEEERQRESD